MVALIAGFGGMFGALVAAFAIRSNGNSSRATTVQKANETELKFLQL